MELQRRQFIQGSLLASTGILLSGTGLLVGCSSKTENILSTTDTRSEDLGVWLHISPDNSITFVVPSSEMGQGVSTSLTTIVAEELDIDYEQINTVHAHASAAYNNAAMPVAAQGTGGSNAVLGWWEPLQKMAASARSVLVQTAADRWGVPPSSCRVEAGVVIHSPSDQRLTYGELAADAAHLELPKNPQVKDPADYRYVGKPMPRKDGLEKVTGTAEFGIDIQIPGMLYAAVRQSPVFGGEVLSYRRESIDHINGVIDIVAIPNGIVVVATNYWRARKAALALDITFSEGSTAGLNNAVIYDQFSAALQEIGKAELSGNKIVDVEYEVPYLAHATMEPMNCTADVRAESCKVWVPSQMQGAARSKAAKITGLDEKKIRINTTYLGGGFGRRGEQDFVEQAVTVSKAVGKPVKLVWTREEDTQHDFYRPAYLSRIQVALGDDGYPIQFMHQLAGPAMLSRLVERLMGLDMVGSAMRWLNKDPTSTEGASELPYAIADHQLDYKVVDPGIPVGSWRSVGNSHNAFTTECAIDEAAHLAGIDPYEYRRTLLVEHPRHKAVLERAAQEVGWGKALPQGRAQGIAVHKSFKSYVAQVAEVSVANGKVKVHKVHCVIDCGRYVNPDIIAAQLQGAVVQALSSTLNEKIAVEDGAVANSNFDDYSLIAMVDTPDVTVSIMENNEAPGGVGEPGVPPLPPAVCNAIFAATGKRIRKLPIADQLA